MDYKSTLNLPKTTFSMKADLVQKEPSILKMWHGKNIYGSIRKKRTGQEKFILHDGPPYANGHIHAGHVLNKILKDIIIKFWTMKGFDSPFVPGWDCHGLPVEHQLFKELGISKHDIGQVEFRKKAKDYALKFVKIQREEFERLGVFGDWDNPYLTLDPKYEAGIVRAFSHLVKEGYIYKDLKPVNWCTTCETALAEAEVEYKEYTSPSIYVKFKVEKVKGPSGDLEAAPKDTFVIIWTTTPWTLVGNVAVAIQPKFQYKNIVVNGEHWIMLDSLVESTMQKINKPFREHALHRAEDLENAICIHPFIERTSKIVLARYVSSDEGTGCVHTAPGHGEEDYLTGKKYNLPIIMPVDPKGIFDSTSGEFSGLNVRQANPKIIEHLKNKNALLWAEEVTHSYPHCWRCKKPIIFRATEQYFINIDHKDLRKRMLDIIQKDVKWYPEVSQARISRMVENRPDWCLSRQRYWGVPIVAFKCKKCQGILLDHNIIEDVAKIVESEGSEVWFMRDEKEFLPEKTTCRKCGSSEFEKESDIIDVWFESGVSHQSVLKGARSFDFPCQLYLEGSDQHRGWFQSALLTSCAIENMAPFKGVLTHGFVVDGEGKKMSKSLGNVILPQDIMKKYGADILRLWVASSDYSDDVRLSDEILKRLADAYVKMRNTLRFLLGNIYDFNPNRNYVEPEHMLEIDRWMLSRLADVIEEAEKNYSDYIFHKLFHSVYNFCVYEISSLYLDILKDRLYTFGKDSLERRACQTVLYEILIALLKILAPILSFTTEEAYGSLGCDEESIHLSSWHYESQTLKGWKDKALDEKWSRMLEIRKAVLKAMETKRSSNEIGSSLEAKIILYTDNGNFKKFLEESIEDFPALFITSQVEISLSLVEDSERCEGLPLWISVKKAEGAKCARCWKYSETVGSDKEFGDICSGCGEVVRKNYVNR